MSHTKNAQYDKLQSHGGQEIDVVATKDSLSFVLVLIVQRHTHIEQQTMVNKSARVDASKSVAAILRRATDEKLHISDATFADADSFAAKRAAQDAQLVEESHSAKRSKIVVVQATGGGTRSATVLSKDALERLNKRRTIGSAARMEKTSHGRSGLLRRVIKPSKKYSESSPKDADTEDAPENKMERKKKQMGATMDYFMQDKVYLKTNTKLSRRRQELESKLKAFAT